MCRIPVRSNNRKEHEYLQVFCIFLYSCWIIGRLRAYYIYKTFATGMKWKCLESPRVKVTHCCNVAQLPHLSMTGTSASLCLIAEGGKVFEHRKTYKGSQSFGMKPPPGQLLSWDVPLNVVACNVMCFFIHIR